MGSGTGTNDENDVFTRQGSSRARPSLAGDFYPAVAIPVGQAQLKSDCIDDHAKRCVLELDINLAVHDAVVESKLLLGRVSEHLEEVPGWDLSELERHTVRRQRREWIGRRRCIPERATRAGVDARLLVGKRMQHDWPLTLPWLDESRQAWHAMRLFVKERCAAGGQTTSS